MYVKLHLLMLFEQTVVIVKRFGSFATVMERVEYAIIL